jgi:endoglucanase
MLKALSEAVGVSGDEGAVRDLIIGAIEAHVDDYRIDAMGNLIAFKRGTGGQNLVGLVAAHMDEVGFMVTGHDSSGFLILESIGGIDDKILPGLRVLVGSKKMPGVFLWKPIHKGRSPDVVALSNMRVDIGSGSKDAASSAAPIGTHVAFDSQYIELSDTVARGKAFDDRAGCAELIDLCQGDALPFDLYAAFTVQEEVGLRCATVLVESIQPDFAIILEATACHETPQDPDEPDMTTVTRMGQGPAITYMDRTSIAHPGLLRHFIATAEEEGIPHQFRSPQFAGGTDAGSIHISGAGVPSLGVSLPCRYLHGPNSIISLQDYDRAVQLVRAALTRITPSDLER